MPSNCTTGGLDWILGKKIFTERFSSVGTNCQGQLWNHLEGFKNHVGVGTLGHLVLPLTALG